MDTFDAAVVGAGPAGITAALYLVRSGRSVILFEKLTPGGQVLLTDAMENYPGFPKGIKGWELADAFNAHLDGLDLTRSTADVTGIAGQAGAFELATSAGP
ncbi:MAG: FAD-dependent oxidoreductase, partial [Desulfovibrio sp.]|nr:FAD-dependent oxidoreductase [Desulfovibrio sp.]